MALPTDAELIRMAGKGAFDRGLKYAFAGRVALSRHDEHGLAGQVDGGAKYQVRLQREGTHWQWYCSCPAADDRAFCKHLVAAVLIARDGAPDADGGGDVIQPTPASARNPSGSRKTARPTDDGLADFLRAQPAERLAQWLLAFADEDAEIARRLRLYGAANDPDAIKAALGALVQARGFLDYRRSRDYARKLDEVVAKLEATVAGDPTAGRVLCEYVLGRLLTVYANSDDSSGAIGSQLERIADLHLQACHAAPPGKALVKALQTLRAKDSWGTFPLEDYWDALGPEGQSAWGKHVLAAFSALPDKVTDASRWGPDADVVRQTEEYAHVTDDFDLLQRVLRRDLHAPGDYRRVFASLRDAGREREALVWIEQAVKRFRDDRSLRSDFAGALARAGLDEEACEQHWHALRLSPDILRWNALKHGAGDRWPAWRERSLQALAAQEHGDASTRVDLLADDGDLDAAVALANTQLVRPETLERLALRIEPTQPLQAGVYHLRRLDSELRFVSGMRYETLVQTLVRVARCLPKDQWLPYVAKIRAEHMRKTKLMKMLDAAGF